VVAEQIVLIRITLIKKKSGDLDQKIIGSVPPVIDQK
jgi:hypothetical protein